MRRKVILAAGAIVIAAGVLSSFFIITNFGKVQYQDFKTEAYKLTTEQIVSREHKELTSDYNGENILSYKNADGTKTIYMFSAPIEESNNTISLINEGNLKSEGYRYLNDGRYIQKLLPDLFSRKTGVIIQNGENYLEVFPSRDINVAGKQLKMTNALGQNLNSIKYSDVFNKGIDLNCYITSFGVNTEIVLPKYTGQNKFKLKIKLPDLVPDTTSPDYILFKTALENGEVRSIAYTPLAVDKNCNNVSYNNTIKLISKDSTTNIYTIEYTIDETFLKSNKTEYPVIFNQSFYLYKSKQPDTSAYSKTGDEADHYLSPYILLGDSTIKGEGRAFIRYESLANLNVDPNKILSAKYIFRNLFDLPKDTKISAYAVTTDWCSLNTRWFNKPPFDPKTVSSVIVKSKGDYSVDITEILKVWINNKGNKDAKYSIQNGFMLKSETPNSSAIFSSGDNGLFSPLIEIIVKG